ncbi:MAG: hypothetical protein HYS55_01560 [Candidatus Omnitrophica bacterium]|nr:hypothetical protein [Candidatus Omnitrophota bacterium]
MPEEKAKETKEAKQEEVHEKAKEKPQEKSQEKPVESKPAEESKSKTTKKRRKVSGMTLAEVESELKTVKEKMGAYQSAFAQHLLARKKELAFRLFQV